MGDRELICDVCRGESGAGYMDGRENVQRITPEMVAQHKARWEEFRRQWSKRGQRG
jgi:hypothetical protein